MKKVLIVLTLFIMPLFLSAQSTDEIKREASPEYKYVQDNSEQAQLLRTLTEARKNGNTSLFTETLNKLNSKYAGNGTIINNPPLPDNRNYFMPSKNTDPEEVYAPDWADGENQVFGRTLAPSSPGNPNYYNRMLRLQADSMGVMYCGFINNGKDTLFFYKSTNKGASWAMIQALHAGVGKIYYSFDFAIADTAGGFKIGMVVSISPESTPYQGTIYYADMLGDGSSFNPSTIEVPAAGRGLIGPVICTDGYNWSPASTYWYIAYSNCDATTGVTSSVPAVYTPNWGTSWVRDTARSTYNDYELDIDYNFGSDTIYVLLTNNLTSTNENLRLRYIALADWGTSANWKQFNPANTSNPEYNGCIAINRKTNTTAVTYTITESSDDNIKYSYSLDGTTPGWVTDNVLSAQANPETRSTIQSLQQQSGVFRVCYSSLGLGFDTIVYKNTFTIGSGFGTSVAVSRAHGSSGVYAPAITGYYFNGSPGFAGAGVIYAGVGPSKVWFNGSDIITGINNPSADIPGDFRLNQNYPNPFNPVTKIEFSVPRSSHVRISVFDVMGREVMTLVNERMAPGKYEANWDASAFSSGVYFYRMSAEGFVETRKMMVVK